MFKNKRILVTLTEDRNLYEDLLQFLLQEKSAVITLVSKKSMKESMEKYSKVISIVLDIFRCEAGENTPERVLLENLPFFHHVINFAGEAFMDKFLDVQKTMRSKIQYEISPLEIGSVRSKIKHKNLIPSGNSDSFTIVNVIPDISLGQTIRESFGKIGKSNKPKDSPAKVSGEGGIEGLSKRDITDEELNPNIQISRYSVFRRSLSIRVRKSYPVRQILNDSTINLSNLNSELDYLFVKENEKIKSTINNLYIKNLEKEKNAIKKLYKVHERKENKLNKEIKKSKLENIQEAEIQIEPLNEGTRSRVETLGEETANKIIESREKQALRRGLKSTVRSHAVETRLLEQALDIGLKNLAEEYYVKLICKEAKKLKQITKKYMEKRKAFEKLYQNA